MRLKVRAEDEFEASALTQVARPAPAEPSGWLPADRYFERTLDMNAVMRMPDGVSVPVWAFDDPASNRSGAGLAPMIRVREREIIKIKLTLPDGGRPRGFVYQWQPQTAGTYFYHGHQSSLRDFEMGLFGPLIVEPEPDAQNRPRAFKGGPEFDVEQVIVLDDLDPAWHRADPIDQPALEVARFEPRYFLVNGIPNARLAADPGSAVRARPGQRVLLRVLNASFSLVRMTIERFHSEVIAVDGHPRRGAPGMSGWQPIRPGQALAMPTAARHDVLIDLGAAGQPLYAIDQPYRIRFEFVDWSTRRIRGDHQVDPLYRGVAEIPLIINS